MEYLPSSTTVKWTKDYSRFKHLEGNRQVLKARKNKIIRSIKQVGYVPAPVVVNEKMEVIDGAGRIEAAKDLLLPVAYVMIPGLTREHCIAMNINSTSWTINDYVNSHAETGNKNYLNLLLLAEKHPRLSIKVVCAAATETAGGSDLDTIKKGTLFIPDEIVPQADETLTWYETSFGDMEKEINGRRETFAFALIWAYKYSTADKKRLVDVLRLYRHDLPPATTVKYTLEMVSKLYNKGLRKNSVYLNIEYDEWCSKTPYGYSGRWSYAARNENTGGTK